jgi:hypothetical protein
MIATYPPLEATIVAKIADGSVLITSLSGPQGIPGGLTPEYINAYEAVLAAVPVTTTAVSDAQAAQGLAEAAQGLAETAQGAAEVAQGWAETAQGNAETARTGAQTAQGLAETAQGLAETAQGLAEAAQADAEAAAIQAAIDVAAEIALVVDSSPATLDTLNELAAALGDDPNFATTVATNIGLKAPLASPTLTGTPAAPTAAADTSTTQVATTAFVVGQGYLKASAHTSELPTQTGNTGKYLSTDGSTAAWAAVDALPTQTGHGGQVLSTDGTTATWQAAAASGGFKTSFLLGGM